MAAVLPGPTTGQSAALPTFRLIPDFTGFGRYDREVIEALSVPSSGPYPYFPLALYPELGYEYCQDSKLNNRAACGVLQRTTFILY
jgi:hypothetical protein